MSTHRAPPAVLCLGASAVLGLAYLALAVTGAATHQSLGSDLLENGALVLAGCACLLHRPERRTERGAWLFLGAAILAWGAGNVAWAVMVRELSDVPYPSIADAGYLAFYPLAYLGLIRLVRVRVAGLPVSSALDGLVVACAASALVAAVLYPGVVDAGDGPATAIATNLAYPIADLVLLGLSVSAIVMAGSAKGRGFLLVALGMVVFVLTDSVYLARVANDSYTEGTVLDAGWVLGIWLVASAVLGKGLPRVRAQHSSWLDAIPIMAAALCITVVIAADTLDPPRGVIWLAAFGAATAIARLGLTLREVRALAEAQRLSLTDELTGLPNHRALVERLSTLRRGDSAALLLTDLRRFRDINHTLGHVHGDYVLTQVAARLGGAAGRGDFVARLGGDEFAVLAYGVKDTPGAVAAAGLILHEIQAPLDVEGLTLEVEAVIGAALYAGTETTPPRLLKAADVAMERARERNIPVECYEPAFDDTSRERLVLGSELRAGIPRGEVVVFYQPKIRLSDGAPAGVEALVRWRHPRLGLLLPGSFLPAIEDSAVMRALTTTVLADALRQVADWNRGGLRLPVSVNASPVDLLDTAFARSTAAAVEAAGLTTDMLIIEVTENVLMIDTERTLRNLDDLRATGIRVSIDDFGTGHSSLGRLKDLPVDEIKLDRSFVAGMARDPRDAAIVDAAVSLARNMGLTTVAEGIEDESCAARLRGVGCDLGQGYLYGRPMPAEEIVAWSRVPASS